MVRGLEGALTIVDTFTTSVNEAILVPVRRRHRRLFLELFALSTVLSAAFYLFKCLALATGDGAAADLYLSLNDMDLFRVNNSIATWLKSDHPRLLPLAYLVAGITAGTVTYIATISAAVLARRHDSGQMERLSLLSFLGTVKRNLARPAKVVCLNCVLRVAVMLPLAILCQGELHRSEVVYPALLVYLLGEFVCKVAVVASVAEGSAAGESAVGRACRVMWWGKCKEFLIYWVGQSVIHQVFSAACALVAMAGLPQQVGAGVTCMLLGANQVFSVANVTAYYLECRKKKEEQEQTRACHVEEQEQTRAGRRRKSWSN